MNDAYVWLTGRYASRLHAVSSEVDLPTGHKTIQAKCGAFVYGKAPHDFAQRKLDNGVPRCKHCEKAVYR